MQTAFASGASPQAPLSELTALLHPRILDRRFPQPASLPGQLVGHLNIIQLPHHFLLAFVAAAIPSCWEMLLKQPILVGDQAVDQTSHSTGG